MNVKDYLIRECLKDIEKADTKELKKIDDWLSKQFTLDQEYKDIITTFRKTIEEKLLERKN